MSGQVVYGKYRLIRSVASGGMAEVLLARSSSIGGFEKILAIKRMHPRLSTHQGFVSLFIQEAKLWVALNHPNIVQVFDFGKVDDNYYIAMEFVDGLDLAYLASQARRKKTPLDPAAAIYIMKKVFDGMAYAHNKRDRLGKPSGVIHRDISPHNILVSFEGQVKISDFGIAKAVEELQREANREIVGKVAYISPEQARGEIITTQADIWSGGVILYELLANARLFSRDNDQETLAALSSQAIESLLKFNPHLPLALDSLVQNILSRHVSDRAQSAREVAESLNDILGAYFPRMNEFRLSEIIAELIGNESPSMLRDLDGSQPPRFVYSGRPEGTPLMTNPQMGERNISTTDFKIERVDEPTFEDIERLKITFAESPNLWVLVDIADLYFKVQRPEKAFAGYELAAAKFMQRGLMVQAMTIYARLLKTLGPSPRLRAGVRRLPEFKGLDHASICELVMTAKPTQDFTEYLNLLETEDEDRPQQDEIIDTPILGALGPDQLEYVLGGLRLSHSPASNVIAQEGDPGHSFFWIGRGRVVISTKNFENKRVYLTSLSEGDCFGEHSFFSGLPRESHVETADESWVLEIAKPMIDQLIVQFPPVLETLRQFYKSRIAESLIARSELLGSMSIRHRRRLAEQFSFFDEAKDALIICEGDASDAFYAIKSGKVEVFSSRDGQYIVLATLGAGEVFGEIAALKGIARTASVRALERCEILKLEASDLRSFLEENPEIREKVETQIESRADETARLLTSELRAHLLAHEEAT
jgi:serine/threonine protein kinase/CRP-like cAMP-binding protein